MALNIEREALEYWVLRMASGEPKCSYGAGLVEAHIREWRLKNDQDF